jgi:hypothetical protein
MLTSCSGHESIIIISKTRDSVPHHFSQPCFFCLSTKYAFNPTPRQLDDLGITQVKMLSDQFVLIRKTTSEDSYIIRLPDSQRSIQPSSIYYR